MKNKQENLIQALEEMDLQKINDILEEGDYDGTSKKIYLKKIEQVFEDMKANGDSFLKAFPGHATTKDSKKEGVVLVGNHSKDYTKFLFKEDPLTLHFELNLLPYTLPETVKDLISISIFSYEKTSFKDHDIFEVLKVEIQKAFDEFDPEIIYKFHDLKEWRSRQDKLLDYILATVLTAPETRRFLSFYYGSIHLSNDADAYMLVPEVAAAYKKLDPDNEKEILQWLVDFEGVGDNLGYIYDVFEKNELTFDSEYLVYENIKIDMRSCLSIFWLYKYYHLKYREMLEKYRMSHPQIEAYQSLNSLEWQFYAYHEQMEEKGLTPPPDYWYKLSYHLKEQGIL